MRKVNAKTPTASSSGDQLEKGQFPFLALFGESLLWMREAAFFLCSTTYRR